MQQHIEILLADGTTRLESRDYRPKSESVWGWMKAKEVLVLLKSAVVAVTRDAERAKAADNQLQGTIQHIERGEAQCEV